MSSAYRYWTPTLHAAAAAAPRRIFITCIGSILALPFGLAAAMLIGG